MYSMKPCACCGLTKYDVCCTRCETTPYCTVKCLEADSDAHKRVCDGLIQAVQPWHSIDLVNKPFHAIHNDTFLHKRTEKETFALLIDILRMRVTDQFCHKHEPQKGTVLDCDNTLGIQVSNFLENTGLSAILPAWCTAAQRTSEPAFRAFIEKAAEVPGFLPPWWSRDKLETCIRYSLGSEYHSLTRMTHKYEMQMIWKDEKMPLKMRLLAKRVYGNFPEQHMALDDMLPMIMSLEAGSSTILGSAVERKLEKERA